MRDMSIAVVFKIAGIGILVAIICQLLKQTGRDDMAMLAALSGLVLTLSMVADLIGDLFENVRRIFELY
jgi:stage III sporulation protein AC